jgi:hypothetical protein
MSYSHTQIGYVTGGAGALATAWLAVLARHGGLGGIGLVLLVLMGAVTILFSTLTVTVSDEELRFYFGPGFWERRFPVEDIERVEVVRNSALHGWGIRYTHHGWLYDVSGLRAVEIVVRGEEQLRIGTDEPEQLKRALERAKEPAPRR